MAWHFTHEIHPFTWQDLLRIWSIPHMFEHLVWRIDHDISWARRKSFTCVIAIIEKQTMHVQKDFGYVVTVPQSLYIAMDSYSATDPYDNCCIMTVTVLNYREDYISRPDAFKWATKIIRTATKEADTSFEGELHKVIPLSNRYWHTV